MEAIKNIQLEKIFSLGCPVSDSLANNLCNSKITFLFSACGFPAKASIPLVFGSQWTSVRDAKTVLFLSVYQAGSGCELSCCQFRPIRCKFVGSLFHRHSLPRAL